MDEREWYRWQARTDVRLDSLDDWRTRVDGNMRAMAEKLDGMLSEERIASEVTRRLKAQGAQLTTLRPRRSLREWVNELSLAQKAGSLFAAVIVAVPAITNFVHVLFHVGAK